MSENLNKKIKPVPKQSPEIGIDTEGTLIDNIIDGTQIGAIDISSIDALSQSAQSREQMYKLIDSMSTDDIISAVLETYAEDAVQTNDKGEVVWVEASDSNVLDYTTWLLDSLNLNKNMYQWAHCLVTYGDVYCRLYRQSDYGNDLLFKDNVRTRQLNETLDKTKEKQLLSEDVKLRLYSLNDPYIPYVEMVNNPGEMFDLQKFGKTHGYIKASTRVVQETTDQLYSYLTRYKMKQNDVEVYDAMSFVHGCLENTTQRQPETVDIYLDSYKKEREADLQVSDDTVVEDQITTSYSVKRGQSLLYNSFRIWRELNLLEMSALLNRITQSSVIRVLGIETGDMPKEQVRGYMERLKEKIEQKIAVANNVGMAEYNNPAPVINTIYVPTHNGQGNITATNIGGDFDPKSLTDIEYFRDKLFGSLKVPKQFFGFTEDGAGFNGGQSLTILSSRYGKSIKKIQNVLCGMVTDIINLFLIDRGLDNYVNQFTIRMQPPVTQEELDRRTNTDNRIRYVGDVMNQLSEIEDKATKLKIQKALLSGIINDSEVIQLLDQYIDSLEVPENPEEDDQPTENGLDIDDTTESSDFDLSPSEGDDGDLPSPEELSLESFYVDENKDLLLEGDDSENDSYLPSAEDLGMDFTVDPKELEKKSNKDSK